MAPFRNRHVIFLAHLIPVTAFRFKYNLNTKVWRVKVFANGLSFRDINSRISSAMVSQSSGRKAIIRGREQLEEQLNAIAHCRSYVYTGLDWSEKIRDMCGLVRKSWHEFPRVESSDRVYIIGIPSNYVIIIIS